MSESHLPPLGSDYVFSVSSSALINAPIHKVWAILLDLPNYKEWNTCVRSITMVTSSKVTLPSQTPVVGEHILLNVHMPPTMEKISGLMGAIKVLGVITHIDNKNYHVSWNMACIPYFLLHSERCQALSVDQATGKTKYETIEVLGGILAYFMRHFMGAKFVMGIRATANTLKARAEQF